MKFKISSLVSLLLILCTCLTLFASCDNDKPDIEKESAPAADTTAQTSSPENSFETSPGLAYIVNEDGKTASIIGIGTCNHAQIIIGETIQGYPITTIFPTAFQNNPYISNVIISDNVTYIGQHAFENCVNLTKIVLPQGITEIYEDTFSGCGNLISINIPGSVKKIGNNAFYECKSLLEVHADNVESWCGIQFANIYANPLYDGASFCIDGAPVTKLVIPDNVLRIHSHAFYGCHSITSVSIPKLAYSIGDRAFENCKNLATVFLPDNGIEIGSDVFYGTECYNSDTYRPGNVMYIGKHLIDADNYYWNNDWDNKTYRYNVKAGTLTIATSAFKNCEAVSNIVLPDSLLYIYDYAFDGCENLVSITIPDSVRSFGFYAFDGCYDLAIINYTGSEEDWNNISGLAFAKIPSGVKINFNYTA